MTGLPPPPPPPDAPLKTTEHLRVGDVVQIAVQGTDRDTGVPFWWRRFAAVLDKPSHGDRMFLAGTLKMRFDKTKDARVVKVGDPEVIVTLLPERMWPAGVIAARLKLIHTGHLSLGDE